MGLKNDYIAFIAGLPEMEWTDRKLSLTLCDFRDQARSYIRGKDEKLLNLFFLSNDNRQVLRLLNKQEPLAELDTVYPLSVLEEEVQEAEGILPAYLSQFIIHFREGSHIYTQRPANVLSRMYYEYLVDSRNAFVADYSTFYMNLKNLVTAINCRKHGKNMNAEIIGENEFAKALQDSHAKDFGLSGDYVWVDAVLALMENPNLVERERGLDLLVWNYLDEAVTFKYFSIERVISFALKLMILERWSRMNSESGRKVFMEMVGTFRQSLTFEKQFE